MDNLEVKYQLGIKVGLKRGHWAGYQEGYDIGLAVGSKTEILAQNTEPIVRKKIVRKRKIILDGNRIQNVPLLADTVSNFMACKSCFGTLKLVDEQNIQGLSSSLIFECDNCHKEISSPTSHKIKVTEQKGEKPRPDINLLAVGATTMIGKGYQGLSTLIGTMGIPCMAHKSFDAIARQVGTFQRNIAKQSELQAQQTERNLLLQAGKTEDAFGNIKTSAINDGGWQKQAYNKNCNSKSGIGVTISAQTSKILDHEVLSIDCAICQSAKR